MKGKTEGVEDIKFNDQNKKQLQLLANEISEENNYDCSKFLEVIFKEEISNNDKILHQISSHLKEIEIHGCNTFLNNLFKSEN